MKSSFPFLPLLLVALVACNSTEKALDEKPAWLEPDSASAMHARLLRDFPISYSDGVAELIEAYPQFTADSIREFVDRHYIETMVIDGQERMFRKAKRNLPLLHPALNQGWKHRGWNASPERVSYVDSVMRHSRGELADGAAHRVHMRFNIDVPNQPWLQGDTLRVWMPYPIESERQGDIELLSASSPQYIISTPQESVHRTIYFEAPVTDADTIHFDYEVAFTTRGQYFDPEEILARLQPYDTQSAEYLEYTSFAGPHYARLDSLAHSIVGAETNPYRQSELVFDYIIDKYPWAGAREYSTLACIPEYVVAEGHGDCGQVALLYISLMRSLGVPARWESGWMLHPGELNYHDWAEVYYPGTGWVPVDISFGRYDTAPTEAARNFYSTGIDAHRFSANTGIAGAFYPAKRFLRSETVDSQAGEVECSQGNLFYPGWDQKLDIISITPIAE